MKKRILIICLILASILAAVEIEVSRATFFRMAKERRMLEGNGD